MTEAHARRSLGVLAMASMVGFAVLVALGAWQWQRRSEKAAFLDRLLAQATAPAAAIPPVETWAKADLAALDLARVAVSGRWLEGQTATVRVAMPRAEAPGQSVGGFGRYLMAALELEGGGIVLVNRGFVPEEHLAAVPPAIGTVRFTGLLRRPEIGNPFTPPADIPRRDFHVRDPAAIAAALGISAAPFVVERERTAHETGWPRGTDIAELAARIPNNHLPYALTWWGLALTLAGVFAALWWRTRRESMA